jgi:methionyl-tRNA formyltransferase
MQWALINGEKETGVSSFWLDKDMDAGPLFHAQPVPIAPSDTLPSLREKLITAGVAVLERVMKDVGTGKISKEPQTGAPTFAPQLTKETGRVKWTQSASEIANLIRGVVEWPGAFSFVGGKRLKISAAEADATGRGKPGEILDVKNDRGLRVGTGSGTLWLTTVQPDGKKPMPAGAFWQGAHLKMGDFFE